MPFVKLDCGLLDSTLWVDRTGREVFITALLLAEPFETDEPLATFKINSLEADPFTVPAGWYGFCHAAGVGILRRALVDQEDGMAALHRLAAPDPESRSPAFEGRRLVRVAGGYVVLNYDDYRKRDYTSAARSKRYRDRLAKERDGTTSRRVVTPLHSDITQAEAEAEAEAEGSITDPGGSVGKTPHVSPCPHQRIVDLYHQVLPTLSKVVRLTPARRQQIRARWNEDNQDLDGWRLFFVHVSESDFLMGRSKARQDSAVPFQADLEWLTKAANWIKVIEGKYHHG